MICQGCGEELKQKFVFSHYDRNTGKRMFVLEHKCPHHSWQNPFRYSHTKYAENKYYTEEESQ